MDDRILDLVGNFESAFQSRWIRLMSCNQIAVTGFEAKLLLLISRHADCSQHALATLVSRDKAQIARAIKDLEMKGYLNRSPHKPNGRILKLNLTSEGASVCEKLKIYRAEILNDMLSGLSSDEKLTFEKLLARAILEPRWNK